MSVARANVPDASLHPLLYNTGTVAAAAGSFRVKRGDESKTTVEPKGRRSLTHGVTINRFNLTMNQTDKTNNEMILILSVVCSR